MEKTKETYQRKALCDPELEPVVTEHIMGTLANLGPEEPMSSVFVLMSWFSRLCCGDGGDSRGCGRCLLQSEGASGWLAILKRFRKKGSLSHCCNILHKFESTSKSIFFQEKSQ